MLVRPTLVAFLLLAGAPYALASDPAGHYAITGTGPGETEAYTGTVDVTKTGDTYHVVWLIGGEKFIGTGIGDENFLAISYQSGKNTGLALYGEKGNDWTGIWTYAGGTKIGAEQWTRK